MQCEQGSTKPQVRKSRQKRRRPKLRRHRPERRRTSDNTHDEKDLLQDAPSEGSKCYHPLVVTEQGHGYCSFELRAV